MIRAKDEARAVDQKHVMRRCRGRMRNGGLLGLRNDYVDDLVHGFLPLEVAPFPVALRPALAGTAPGPLFAARGRHRAVDEETGTVRTLGLPGRGEIEINPGVTERPAAAVAGGDHRVDVDGFEGRHR